MDNWTGPLPDLSEKYKTFVDDMSDADIVSISKRHISAYPTGLSHGLINKSGKELAVGYNTMCQIKYYCRYLIAIGAVKSAPPIRYSANIVSDSAS